MRIIFLWILLAIATELSAEVRLAEVFTSNMVLQQGKPICIWGMAEEGERLTIRFAGQKVITTADADKHWSVELKPMHASEKPRKIFVSGKHNMIVLNNILIGEVWLASGQSNMEYSMNNHPHFIKPRKGDPDYLLHEWERAENPNIRLLYIEKNLKCDTLPTKGWQMVGKESLKPFSAAAWFFAKMLQDSLRIPIGIISSSWGGTKIEKWTPGIGMQYKKMVEPLTPFAIRGVLWYQGESNLIDGDTDIYTDKQKHLITSWRSAWHDDTLPFYYVQISPLTYSQRKAEPYAKRWTDLPRFWEAQTRCLVMPHTGMVVTTDIPEDINDIHPPYKWIVGERLARWALHDTYGYSIECEGPTLRSVRIEGDKAMLEFDHADGGLITSDGKAPNWFYTNSLRNGFFKRTDAVIDGNKVIVTINPQVDLPIIRFGYDEVAQPNLRNRTGLPAVPFEYKVQRK